MEMPKINKIKENLLIFIFKNLYKKICKKRYNKKKIIKFNMTCILNA